MYQSLQDLETSTTLLSLLIKKSGRNHNNVRGPLLSSACLWKTTCTIRKAYRSREIINVINGLRTMAMWVWLLSCIT